MASTLVTSGELRKMPIEELRREARSQQSLVAKMRIEVQLKKEKDTARLRREKRQLARMLTVLGSLKPKPKSRRIASPTR